MHFWLKLLATQSKALFRAPKFLHKRATFIFIFVAPGVVKVIRF